MKIRVHSFKKVNRPFLFRSVDDQNHGLMFISTTKAEEYAGILNYVVINKPLFMLAVIKYGIEYEVID